MTDINSKKFKNNKCSTYLFINSILLKKYLRYGYLLITNYKVPFGKEKENNTITTE